MDSFRKYILLIVLLVPFISMAQGEFYIPQAGRSVRPAMKVLQVEQRQGYECSYIEFSVEKSERIRAYLLVPDKASRTERCPAVVMLHDHGARFDIGKEKLVRPMTSVLPQGNEDHIVRSSQQWINKNFDGVYFADSLAALGYVVLVADALYWGERSSEDAHHWSELSYGDVQMDPKERKALIKSLKTKVYDGQKVLYDSLLERDIIWAEKMLRDDVASVRLLKRLPFVDKNNIGSFGFSMGAHRCWMLCAFCEEVKCGAALSWMTSLDRAERMKPSDYSMAVMPMREQLDFGDIGLFLSPKPMLFLNGTEDHLFPRPKVEMAFSKLRKHYKNSPAALQATFFEGGHHCGREVQSTIILWLDECLK